MNIAQAEKPLQPPIPPPTPPPPPPTDLPVRHLSASSIIKFVSCPEQWRQTYILKIPDAMFGSRFMGIVDHSTIMDVLLAKMHGQEAEHGDITEIYKTSWARALETDGEPNWGKDDPIEMFERGLQMVHAYHETVIPLVEPVAIEQRFTMTVGGVELVGYVDVITTEGIRERKTVDQKMTKPKSRWRLQGRIYHMLTGLPVAWDVVTRQVTTKIYTAEEFSTLKLAQHDPSTTRRIVLHTAERIKYLMATLGPDVPWPYDGFVAQDWLCDYCGAGPKFGSACGVWR
jgi:hypothetical protein